MRRALGILTVSLALLGLCSSALADPIGDYRRNGTIDPCKYSPGQLKKELSNLPPDVQQYAPGLADQLNQGRQGCGAATGGSGDTRDTQAVPTPAKPGNGNGGSSGAAKAAVPDPPAPVPEPRRRLTGLETPAMNAQVDQGAPGWVLPAVVAALAAALLVAVVRVTGLGAGRSTRSLRAAFSEAGARTGESMTQLWDRVRLGR